MSSKLRLMIDGAGPLVLIADASVEPCAGAVGMLVLSVGAGTVADAAGGGTAAGAKPVGGVVEEWQAARFIANSQATKSCACKFCADE